MNPPEQNDWLDRMLREETPHIADEGFTRRVLTALPRSRRRAWVRPVVLLGASALGSVAAWWLLPDTSFLTRIVASLPRAVSLTQVNVAALLLLAAAAWGAYAAATSES